MKENKFTSKDIKPGMLVVLQCGRFLIMQYRENKCYLVDADNICVALSDYDAEMRCFGGQSFDITAVYSFGKDRYSYSIDSRQLLWKRQTHRILRHKA